MVKSVFDGWGVDRAGEGEGKCRRCPGAGWGLVQTASPAVPDGAKRAEQGAGGLAACLRHWGGVCQARRLDQDVVKLVLALEQLGEDADEVATHCG